MSLHHNQTVGGGIPHDGCLTGQNRQLFCGNRRRLVAHPAVNRSGRPADILHRTHETVFPEFRIDVQFPVHVGDQIIEVADFFLRTVLPQQRFGDELVVNQTLPQLKAHVGASLNVGCTPSEIRETVYQCAPFVGFPKTLNAIAAMNEVFSERGITLPLPATETVTEEDRFERGLAVQKPLYGDEIKERYAWLPGEFSEAVPRWLTELSFGDFATRAGLPGKERELLTVVMLAAMGGAEVQVKSHIAGALKAGNTKEEVMCALAHAMPYMGVPRFFNALNCAKELLA